MLIKITYEFDPQAYTGECKYGAKTMVGKFGFMEWGKSFDEAKDKLVNRMIKYFTELGTTKIPEDEDVEILTDPIPG